jgi:hypothetical protein
MTSKLSGIGKAAYRTEWVDPPLVYKLAREAILRNRLHGARGRGGPPRRRSYCGGIRSGIWIRAIAFTISQKRTPETSSSPSVTANSPTDVAITSSP